MSEDFSLFNPNVTDKRNTNDAYEMVIVWNAQKAAMDRFWERQQLYTNNPNWSVEWDGWRNGGVYQWEWLHNLMRWLER